MKVLSKLFLITVLLVLLPDTPVVTEALYYSNRPGQPSNIHYIEHKPGGKAGNCSKKSKLKCHTAEIIKVPLRNHSSDCPKNQKKDAKGRCRLSWT